jgi:hypothetical protein
MSRFGFGWDLYRLGSGGGFMMDGMGDVEEMRRKCDGTDVILLTTPLRTSSTPPSDLAPIPSV